MCFELLLPSPPSVPLMPLIHAGNNLCSTDMAGLLGTQQIPKWAQRNSIHSDGTSFPAPCILNLSNWAANSRHTWWFCHSILCAVIAIQRKTDAARDNYGAMKTSTSAPSAGFVKSLREHRKSSETSGHLCTMKTTDMGKLSSEAFALLGYRKWGWLFL